MPQVLRFAPAVPAAAFAIILWSAATITAEAQTRESRGGSASLEEIVVTATRREEALQDVPLAVSAVSAEGLVARGINTLSDLEAGAIPGVLFGTFTNMPSIMKIAVRGVSVSDPSQGTVEMPVPVYIDGVFLGRAQGAGLDLIEPERIEILRGPQGQLFGRNAEGGVVQYVTRKPSGELGVRASASYGNYDDQRYRLSVDLPKVGGFSTQLSAIKSRHDPYTEQPSGTGQTYVPPSPNKDPALFDQWGARAAVRWQSEGGFTADYAYDYTDSEEGQPYVTWIPLPGATPFSPQPPSTDYPDDATARHYNPFFTTKGSGHALTLTWQASDAITWKSITAYRKVSRSGGSNLHSALPIGFSSGGALETIAIEDLDQDQTSQEFQFVGSWDRFDLTAGATYYNEDVRDGRISQVSGPGLTGTAASVQPAGLAFCVLFQLDPCMVGDTRQRADTDSYGVYAQGTYRPAVLDDRLELIAGLRYSDDTKKARRTYSLIAGGPVDQRAKFSASRVDPAATIKYRWTDDVSTYLRYATGYRAGGANIRSSTFTSYDEEVNTAWELGMKSRLGNVLLNVALFHTTIEDEQLTIQEAPTVNPSLTNTANSSKDKKIKGVEVETQWAALPGVNLGLNLAYMDADDAQDIDNPFTPGVVDLTRFWTLFVPEISGSVYADLTKPLDVGSLAFHVDYSYADDYWETPFALRLPTLEPNQMPTLDSSQLAARLAWRDIEVGQGKLEVALWGRNLLDDDAIAFQFGGCASGGGMCTYRTNPRTYGVELRYSL